MAAKRRIVWLTDEEWSDITAISAERGETISRVVRDMIGECISDERRVVQALKPHYGVKGLSPFGPKDAKRIQAERDAILRGVNRR